MAKWGAAGRVIGGEQRQLSPFSSALPTGRSGSDSARPCCDRSLVNRLNTPVTGYDLQTRLPSRRDPAGWVRLRCCARKPPSLSPTTPTCPLPEAVRLVDDHLPLTQAISVSSQTGGGEATRSETGDGECLSGQWSYRVTDLQSYNPILKLNPFPLLPRAL